jgi:hypothetical protein
MRKVSGPNTKYGLLITKNGKTFEKWYGSDSVKRDEAHNTWVAKGATVVQDIEKAK